MAQFKHGSLLLSINTENLTSDKTLAYNCQQLQFLNPSGQDRNVLLPPESQSGGLPLHIINTSSTYNLNIYDDSQSTLIAIVRPNDISPFYCDGNIWKGDIEVLKDISRTVTTKTASYSMLDADDVILGDATSAVINITLPNPTTATKKNRDIKKIDISSYAVNILPYGSETIDGRTSFSLTSQYQGTTLITNGTNWYIL